jgi:sugar phosphate isomerase/epimerase
MSHPLGVVQIVFAPLEAPAAANRAKTLGFDHLDLTSRAADEDTGKMAGPLALPVVDRFTAGSPRPGWSTGAPPEGDGMWDRAVRAFRRAPGSRIEPWPGSILNSIAKTRAFLAEAPETRLLLDTGHVANWGEDPTELIALATHIQLRQARRGVPQADEGDIDFGRFLAELDRQGYRGALSIEYFDLPELGYPLDDPVAHAVALAERIRPLL